MSLISLPWFIRSEIISLAVEKNPEYCALGKEWLRQVIKRHGKIVIMDRPPFDRDESRFRQYIERMNIHREDDIDWDETCFKIIKYLGIYIYPQDFFEYDIFKRKLQLFSSLRELHFHVPQTFKFDYSKLLLNNQNHLEKIHLSNCWADFYPPGVAFPNLRELWLQNTRLPSVLQSHLKSMPSLKKLYISSSVELNHEPLPSVRILEFHADRNPSFSFDLGVFPNIKELHTDHELTSKGLNVNIIDKARIVVSASSFDSFSSIEFPKLRILKLRLGGQEFGFLGSLLLKVATLKSLTTFELSTYGNLEFQTLLPVDTFSFTTMTFKGRFTLKPDTLKWLSTCSKVEHLSIVECRLKPNAPRKTAPFEHLKKVTLVSEVTSRQFLKYFGQNYPQLEIEYLEHERRQDL